MVKEVRKHCELGHQNFGHIWLILMYYFQRLKVTYLGGQENREELRSLCQMQSKLWKG